MPIKFLELTETRKEFFLHKFNSLIEDLTEAELRELIQEINFKINTRNLSESEFGKLVVETIQLECSQNSYFSLKAKIKDDFLKILIETIQPVIDERLSELEKAEDSLDNVEEELL